MFKILIQAANQVLMFNFFCSESEVKFSSRRIKHVEKHFGLICHVLGSITRKNARLRDKGK